jgi:hypothetical protein
MPAVESLVNIIFFNKTRTNEKLFVLDDDSEANSLAGLKA